MSVGYDLSGVFGTIGTIALTREIVKIRTDVLWSME